MFVLGAIQQTDKAARRIISASGGVLAVALLTGCMATGEPDFGLVPQESIGMADTSPIDPYAVQQHTENNEAASATAVEMTFHDAAPQTVPYANTSAVEEPEFMLAVAPTTEPTDALEAAASVTTPTPQAETPQQVTATTQSPQPLGRQSRLGRLFSFGKSRPPTDIVHLTGGSGTATPVRGAATHEPRSVIRAPKAGNENLPGVRLGSLFGLGKRSKRSSDREPVKLASAGGLARLAPNGLRAQHDSVQMACLKPKLVRLLKRVKRHYGRDVIVTSGYRSAKRNRRAGGARGSRHTTCEAADIQVPGVTKWQLAKYLRTVRGRGGVGTYCHTKSVHIDIGSKRDWNWRCRRR